MLIQRGFQLGKLLSVWNVMGIWTLLGLSQF